MDLVLPTITIAFSSELFQKQVLHINAIDDHKMLRMLILLLHIPCLRVLPMLDIFLSNIATLVILE